MHDAVRHGTLISKNKYCWLELADCKARLARLQICFGLQKLEQHQPMSFGQRRSWAVLELPLLLKFQPLSSACIPSPYSWTHPDRSSEARGKLDNLRLKVPAFSKPLGTRAKTSSQSSKGVLVWVNFEAQIFEENNFQFLLPTSPLPTR